MCAQRSTTSGAAPTCTSASTDSAGVPITHDRLMYARRYPCCLAIVVHLGYAEPAPCLCGFAC
ncbi:uncharacterized protein B0I36DRAFT_334266 [Microdochium trichocladiopsis]|uniref:Uncharacterized protein n=1 Tax=Microdochium trichocladiopsis TaxID=1682393 RepID=A0A9P9BKL0_9PEZI|nr:uncharacterized protein B0I36DRAFT_334266 [Microdochium trichocladiopsis]KAH7021326.1 hypothetical protein B0I36DRAFT_334266 [Microdochium trichocladiopsis]